MVKTEEGARIKQMLQLVLVCHATPVVVLAMNTKSSGVINTLEEKMNKFTLLSRIEP